jgi:Tfp pilus assembly protein PilO
MKGEVSLKPLALWNAVLAVSVSAAVLSFLAWVALPAPRPKLKTSARIARERQIRKETAAVEARLSEAKQTLDAVAWEGDADRVQSQSMAKASEIARQAKVTLNAFRPQKPSDQGGLERIPFVINLDGTYLGVLEFLRRLETPGNRLSVNLVQLTSAEGNSDEVTATIVVFAFRAKSPPPKGAAPTGSLASSRP